jgi:hypothetical protein
MSPGSESPGANSVSEALGPDRVGQIALYEADLKRHEEALSNIERTETAIRGFAITAVAALVAAAYASSETLLGFVALGIAVYFAFLDYYWSRLEAEITVRIAFLSEIAQSYRRVLSGGLKRRRKSLVRLEADLSSFDPFGSLPANPILCMAFRNWRDKKAWNKRRKRGAKKGVRNEGAFKPRKAPPIGPFKQFFVLYLILAGVSLAIGLTSTSRDQREIILCRPSGQIAAKGMGLNLHGCLSESVQRPPSQLMLGGR